MSPQSDETVDPTNTTTMALLGSICTTATSSTTTVLLATSAQTVINHATVHCQHTIAGNRWLEATSYATMASLMHRCLVVVSQATATPLADAKGKPP
jgi:hypothetical protein